jgi:hypothetical protein
MRAWEFLTEAAKVGRTFQHLEDLAYVEGSTGAIRALDYLASYGKNARNISIKWDGESALYWGREADGTFMLVGKNNWGRPEGRSKSAEELEQFILSRGKGEDWRKQYAANMAAIWPFFEAATPKNFRGFVFGDLLFHPGKPPVQQDGRLVFTPNITTYSIDTNSTLGKRMAAAKVAVTAHEILDEFGQDMGTGKPIVDTSMLNSADVVVLGQTYVSHQPQIDIKGLNQIRAFVNQNAAAMDAWLAPQDGFSDMKAIIYSYINAMSKSKNLDNIETNFVNWLQSNDKVSANKQAKIAATIQGNPKGLPAILKTVMLIMRAKDDLIAQLDAAGSDIQATTQGQPGGEGYISQGDFVKLVPRSRWTPGAKQ